MSHLDWLPNRCAAQYCHIHWLPFIAVATCHITAATISTLCLRLCLCSPNVRQELKNCRAYSNRFSSVGGGVQGESEKLEGGVTTCFRVIDVCGVDTAACRTASRSFTRAVARTGRGSDTERATDPATFNNCQGGYDRVC